MRYAGIDVGSATHYVAVVDEEGGTLQKSRPFEEGAAGYEQLLSWLGACEDLLIAMEATGHYWQNLFAMLVSRGFSVALVNPTRTRRFADEELMRAKTDKIDALMIGRFAAQKRLSGTRVSGEALSELKELVSLRDRLVQDMGDRERQLHRAVDLAFPEFTSLVKDLSSHKATTLLKSYPGARAFASEREGKLANVTWGEQKHRVGRELASQLIKLAKTSVGAHQGEPYRLQIQYFCEDIATLRRRIEVLDENIRTSVDKSDLCKVIATIEGIGPNTAARIVAAVGDPSLFRDGAALAAYVGVVPSVHHSGKRAPLRGACHPTGNAELRAKLWMPTLVAIRRNPWLKAFYERLTTRGKPKMAALIACMRKLLHAVHSVSKSGIPWVPKLAAAHPQTA